MIFCCSEVKFLSEGLGDRIFTGKRVPESYTTPLQPISGISARKNIFIFISTFSQHHTKYTEYASPRPHITTHMQYHCKISSSRIGHGQISKRKFWMIFNRKPPPCTGFDMISEVSQLSRHFSLYQQIYAHYIIFNKNKVFPQLHWLVGTLKSYDPKSRKFFKQSYQNEISARKIELDRNSPYLNIPIDGNNKIIQTGQFKSNCLFARSVKALIKLNIGMKINFNNYNIKIWDNETTEKEKIPVDELSTLKTMNQFMKQRHGNKLRNKLFKGHTFNTLQNSPLSNFFIGNYKAPTADTITRFALLARTNNFPTGELLAKNGIGDGICHKCNQNYNDSLMHRLNGCIAMRNKYTLRHNAIIKEIMREIKPNNNIVFNLDRPINKRNIRLEGNSRNLKPDLWFFTNNYQTLKIIEVTSPYGHLTLNPNNGDRISTLTQRREEKINKYRQLIEDCRNAFNVQVDFYVIVVSSLGAIPDETFQELKALYKDEKTAKIVAKRCTIAALRESMLLMYKNFSRNQRTINNVDDTEEQASPAASDSEDTMEDIQEDAGIMNELDEEIVEDGLGRPQPSNL